MSDRQKIVSRLIADRDFRADYIRAKLEVLIPSQLRALRLREDKTQPELAQLAEMRQSRISAMETPGRVNFNLETLVRMAATLNVGLMVKLVPFSEMLNWENSYSQDTFNVTRLGNDIDFLRPATRVRKRARRSRSLRHLGIVENTPQIPLGVQANPTCTPAQQERPTRFQFETLTSRRQNLTTVPSRSGSIQGLPVLKEAVGAGGNYHYGTR